MYQFVLIVHIIAAVCLIVLVLVQQGKGATVGATFGAGASQTIFGSRGAGSFLLRLTLGFVLVFFATSVTLNWMSSRAVHKEQIQGDALPAGLLEQTTPALPATAESTAASETAIPPLVPASEQAPAPVALPESVPVVAAPAPVAHAPVVSKPAASRHAAPAASHPAAATHAVKGAPKSHHVTKAVATSVATDKKSLKKNKHSRKKQQQKSNGQ